MANGLRQGGRVIYQTDQCLISAEGDKTPRSAELCDKDAKTMRINIKMVIRCPGATFDVEPGTVAPPSTPAEKVLPLPAPPNYDSPDVPHRTNEQACEQHPETATRTNVATRSAPPGTRAPFGKATARDEPRTLSSKRPPNYVWGLPRQLGSNASRSKVVLRPFSERSRPSESAYCFTCRRSSNSSRHVPSGGGPELGFFKGKPPLTPFTRLGCYRTQLKSTAFRFPGRPADESKDAEAAVPGADEIWHVPQADHPPANQPSATSRGSKRTQQKLVSEVIAEKLNLSTSNQSEESTTKKQLETKGETGKEYTYFFVKRHGLVKGWIAPSQAQEPTVSSNDPASVKVEEAGDKQLPPFRRNLQSHRAARWRSGASSALQSKPRRSAYHGIPDYSPLGPDAVSQHRSYMLNRVTLTPFQKRRYCT